MTDIITTPEESGIEGTGILLGGIVFVMFTLLVIFYGLPLIRGAAQSAVPGVSAQQGL